MEAKLIGSRNAHIEKKTSVEKERVKTVDGKDVSFWILLEGALGEVLSPAETASLITKMKRVHAPFFCTCHFMALMLRFTIPVLFCAGYERHSEQSDPGGPGCRCCRHFVTLRYRIALHRTFDMHIVLIFKRVMS